MTDRTTYGFLHSGRLTNADPERELMQAVDGELERQVMPNEAHAARTTTIARTGDHRAELTSDDCLDCDCGVDPKHDCFALPWAHAEDCPYRTQKPRTVTTVYENNTLTLESRDGLWITALCGHCHTESWLKKKFCCSWAESMFKRYFDGRVNLT